MKSEYPDVIYLQWNCGENDPSHGNPNPGDVTWCADKIFKDDVRYVLDKRQKPKRKRIEKHQGGV